MNEPEHSISYALYILPIVAIECQAFEKSLFLESYLLKYFYHKHVKYIYNSSYLYDKEKIKYIELVPITVRINNLTLYLKN